ncbi:hypothetical protein HEP87_41140 [Streptomyces sp. S1D4-11]
MIATHRPHFRPHQPSGSGMAVAGISAALLMLVCCAGPVLLTAGVLGALGAWLSSPWVIATAVILLLAAVAAVVRRRRATAPPAARPPSTPPTGYARTTPPAKQTRNSADTPPCGRASKRRPALIVRCPDAQYR